MGKNILAVKGLNVDGKTVEILVDMKKKGDVLDRKLIDNILARKGHGRKA